MKIEDLLNKTVIIELKDSSIIKGILLSIDDKSDEEGFIETNLMIRINSENYRLIDVNEILTIGELE